MVEQVVVETGFFRFATMRFEARVNKLLQAGWKIKTFCVERHLCRFVCHAILEK